MKDNQDLMTTMREVLYPGSKQESVDMVLAYCKAAKIDPLLKSLHITQINRKEVDKKSPHHSELTSCFYRLFYHRARQQHV